MDIKYPIGKLEVPEEVIREDVLSWLEDISTYTMRLRKTVESLTEQQLQKTYRDGAWNVRQLVHHIADSQLNMYQRLKLALTDDNPHVPAFNKNAWAIQPDTTMPIESSLKMLEGINERIVELGKVISEEDYKRVFTHQLNGEISIGTKLKKLSWHQEHHLKHIEIALKN
ncbi:MAG: YfiT family bacillithiol transferase [Lysinibacillus sp.]